MKKKEEPIRIAQIVGKWIGGGVEAVVMNYYRHLDHSKIQFDFICDDDSTNIPYDEIEKLGGKVILIPPYQKVFKYQRELRRVLRDGKYKIVHSHINTLSVFPLYAAKKVGVPVRIAHSHSTTNKKEKNSILLLAGQGPLQEEIKNKVRELGLDDSVRFLGQRNDANELYQVFDVFLLPSLYEGLPVVGVEAQASGLLCFLSDDMTKETKVLDSTVFMSLSNTAEEWTDEILTNLKDYKRINTKSEVSDNGFDIEVEARKLEKYYIN